VFRLVQELAADGYDVAVACRVLGVSRSGYYDWRNRPPCDRDVEDAYLANTIVDIHQMSRASYGAPRVHAELRLGMGVRVGRKRVARLLRMTGRRGISHRHKRRHRPAEAVHQDLVQRKFVAARPDLLWCTDITEHPTRAGKVYCAAVLDVFIRQVVGWSIADHMRSELVVDALQMAIWRRRPEPGTVVHADRGSQYTSWVFGHRLRDAGLLGSMGRVASSVDNSMIESFWSTMQRELLDTRIWESPEELGSAIFEWIEAWYNPRRRHTAIGMLSPIDYEHHWEQQQSTTALHTAATGAA
jgi:transposase InsO family protein